MASLTLKNIPDELLSQLRSKARADHRSLNQQSIYLLEKGLATASHAERQAEAWERLAGRWRSDLSVEDEVRSIIGQRSAGRAVDL